MCSLQHNPFVAHHDNPSGATYDISNNPHDCKIALHLIQKLWQFDLSKIQIHGMVDDLAQRPVIRVALYGSDGQVFQDGVFDAPFGAFLRVEARDGFTVASAIGRDMIGTLERGWLEANGFSPDFPTVTETKVARNGEITISVQAAI